MRLRRNSLLTFLILLIVTFASLTLINRQHNCPAYAAPATRVYLESIENTSLVIDTEFSINLSVEDVTDLWGFQFELTFNPDVIRGVYPLPGDPDYPFEMGPFLNSSGGIPIIITGAGWDNTTGRLALAGGSLVQNTPEYCPDGDGVLAIITFKVVGLGETEIRLGENTALKDYAGDWIFYGREFVEDGYFRNVDLALTPTASFTYQPVDTPVPLEGYNTTFTSTSTPASGRTIDTYKWYLWITYRKELDGPIITNVATTTHNYTKRGAWNVTLTVIDNQGAVGTITSYVDIKAHDVAITELNINTTSGELPRMNHTDIGDIVEVEITAANEGHFKETFDVTCFWDTYYAGEAHYGTIGTQYDITLDAGATTILTYYWDTEGLNLVHPDYYTLHANASKVQFEYDVEWGAAKIADNELIGHGVRVKFHDIAVTEITKNATAVSPGEIVEVQVTVVNQGDYNETSIAVTARYDENDIDTQMISLLTNKSFAEKPPPWVGEYMTTLTFLWNTTGIPSSTYRLSADASSVPGEYDTINNLLVDGTVKWPEMPEASFVYSPAEPVVGQVVTFNASASTPNGGAIANYTWNFGDLNVTTVTVPVITHTYTSAGTYEVTLNVTDDAGFSDIERKTVVVSPQPIHDIAVTEITASPISPTILVIGDYVTIHVVVMNEGNVEETFSVNVYYDSALIETRPTVTLNAGAMKNLTFIWNTLGVDPGTYTINAEVPQISGEVDTADNTRSDGTVQFISPPTASFVYSPAEPVVGQVVTFDASASTAGSGVIANYTWNFGDGNITTVTVPVITHTYTSTGTYTVTLTVTNDYGLTDTDAKDITVGGPPTASFVYSPAEPVVGQVVTFDASASTPNGGAIANYAWNFGDGNTATVAVPVTTHTYTSAGTYTVTLTVTNDYGLTDTDAKDITVGKAASTISISASPDTVTVGEDITISGSITPSRAAVTVTISHKISEETTWSTLGTASTNQNGQYSYTWTTTTEGEYDLKASWQGDANTLGDESDTVTVTVEAAPADMTLYIVVAIVIVIVVAGGAVYFLKIRKR